MRTRWQMRLDPDDPNDRAIAQWLDEQEDMSVAVKDLILADIERARGRGVLHQVLAEVRDLKRMIAERPVSPQGTPSETTEDPVLAEGIDSLFVG